MSERIYKLQPNRTMALRGFDALGASAAMHSATANSFTVTGNFRDASDFCVLMVWDVDDFYGHPSFKYLPDPEFGGLTLTFDVQYTGLQPLDSAKYPTIDWPYLDVIDMNGLSSRIPLFANAVQVGGNYTAASAVFTVVDSGLQPYDRVTLWYQNNAFDYIVPAGASVAASDVAANLAGQVNAANYGPADAGMGITATASGAQITVTATKPGIDGNMFGLYQINKTSTLSITPASANLSGGDSGAVWRVTLDFSALEAQAVLTSTSIRRMWLTFAPPLANGEAYSGGDWEADFTNWGLSGPETSRMLQVASPYSVSVDQASPACSYSGTWQQVTNFYIRGFAARATTLGSTVRIRYSCGVPHDLYIGTLLGQVVLEPNGPAVDAGQAGIQLDDDAETDLDCWLPYSTDAVITRRQVRANVAPGSHELTMVLKLGQFIDFNYLQAVIASDVPAPLPARSNISAALDFDTDHTYKLPPARVLWMLNQLGFAGCINEYLGVFWWNQRNNTTVSAPSRTITFGGTWAGGESIFLNIGPPDPNNPGAIDPTQPSTAISVISKSVFPADTSDTIAAHFAAFINGSFSGIWASSSGPELTITCRSAAYSFAIENSTATQAASGTITFDNGTLTGGTLGEWDVDPSQSPVMNTGSRAWHTDYYALCNAAGLDTVTAISMELVYPPDPYTARFNDGTSVSTATGFGSYVSSHCAVGGPVLDFQQTVLEEIASLQAAAGLTPFLQMGEFLWWYFPGGAPSSAASMAYYDDATQAAATSALGRALQLFTTPNDDPTVNGSADATFLRNRLRDHVYSLVGTVRAAYANARFEVLLPLDVNYQTPVTVPVGAPVGGQLNHFVNIPTEWLSPATAGFDSLKIEALAFGSALRNLDLARSAMRFGAGTSWPATSRRYLVPAFGTLYPCNKEAQQAFLAGYSEIVLWAIDHVCLYGIDVSARMFTGRGRSSFQGRVA